MKVSAKKYAAALVAALNEASSAPEAKKIIKHFVVILAQRRALRQAEAIMRALETYYDAKSNRLSGRVIFAHKPDVGTHALVQKELATLLGVADISVDVSVDAQLLGGFTAILPEIIINTSIRQQLSQLHNVLAN